jgi:hypothetical protein
MAYQVKNGLSSKKEKICLTNDIWLLRNLFNDKKNHPTWVVSYKLT